MHITPTNGSADTLSMRFENEPIFKEVVEAIYNLDQGKFDKSNEQDTEQNNTSLRMGNSGNCKVVR
jgi:hypothetical protein